MPKLTALFAKRDQVVVVGGSGLYIQALCRGIAPCPPVDPLVRAKLNDALATQGLPHLVELLQQKDPKYCVAADLKNPRRVLRALEVCLSSGGTYSSFRQQLPAPRPFRVVQIGLLHPKEALHRRIETRTETMMAQGFLEEAEKAYPYRSCNALQTLGYRELFRYMEGDCTLPEAVEQIKTNTKRYAKRQMTWFRQDATIRWFLPQEGASIWEWVAEKVAT